MTEANTSSSTYKVPVKDGFYPHGVPMEGYYYDSVGGIRRIEPKEMTTKRKKKLNQKLRRK